MGYYERLIKDIEYATFHRFKHITIITQFSKNDITINAKINDDEKVSLLVTQEEAGMLEYKKLVIYISTLLMSRAGLKFNPLLYEIQKAIRAEVA